MKRLLVLCLLLLSSSYIFSVSVKFFTPEKPEITIKPAIQMSFWPDNKNTGFDFSTIAYFDMHELLWDAGFNINSDNMDFTTQAIYWPAFGKRHQFNLGVAVTYHLYNYYSTFAENDWFIDVCYKHVYSDYFELRTRCGLMIKSTQIYSVKDYMPYLTNKTMNFDLKLSWFPGKNWICYASLASNSYFNYPNFLSIFMGTGVEYKIPEKNISIGLDLYSIWYDGIVVAINPGLFTGSLFMKVKL